MVIFNEYTDRDEEEIYYEKNQVFPNDLTILDSFLCIHN